MIPGLKISFCWTGGYVFCLFLSLFLFFQRAYRSSQLCCIPWYCITSPHSQTVMHSNPFSWSIIGNQIQYQWGETNRGIHCAWLYARQHGTKRTSLGWLLLVELIALKLSAPCSDARKESIEALGSRPGWQALIVPLSQDNAKLIKYLAMA